MQNSQRLTSNIMAFIIIGTAIAFFLVLFVILSYVVIWGTLIGLVLFSVAYVRHRYLRYQHNKRHRIIEHK